MTKQSINIQDGFLFQSLKANETVNVELMMGRTLKGQIKRFDRFAVVLEEEAGEVLIYKHAIATIAAA